MIRIGLLEADVLYPDLISEYRSYGTMFQKALARLAPELSFRFYQIQKGEFPSAIDECDVYLLTGSKTGVYDEASWLEPLANWIQSAYQNQARLIGICFGHQMLAQSLGGQAAKSEKGWGVGNYSVEINQVPNWLDAPTTNFKLIYSHQDQVLQLPTGAQRLAGNAFCPNAAWYLNNQVLCFQGHPEFTPEYFAKLIERRREHIGSERLDKALASLQEENDSSKVLNWLIQFIKS